MMSKQSKLITPMILHLFFDDKSLKFDSIFGDIVK